MKYFIVISALAVYNNINAEKISGKKTMSHAQKKLSHLFDFNNSSLKGSLRCPAGFFTKQLFIKFLKLLIKLGVEF